MAYRMRKMTVTKIEEVTKAKCRIEIDQEFACVLYKGELRMDHIREGEELDPAIYEEIVGKLPELLSHGKAGAYIHVEPSPFADIEYELSSKELDIIKLVADGMNNKEISQSLFLSEGTVRNYISSILDKLQLRDRTQLACFYYKHLT